jgi:L-lactate dehydrogenase
VLTVSTLLEAEYGLKDVCLSVPCIVSQAGVERIIVGKLTDEEQRDLTASAMVLKKTLADLAGEDGKRDDRLDGKAPVAIGEVT